MKVGRRAFFRTAQLSAQPPRAVQPGSRRASLGGRDAISSRRCGLRRPRLPQRSAVDAGSGRRVDCRNRRRSAFRARSCHSARPIPAASDWTCRVIIGGLQRSTVYSYRFTDAQGSGSRIGRTITAPKEEAALKPLIAAVATRRKRSRKSIVSPTRQRNSKRPTEEC